VQLKRKDSLSYQQAMITVLTVFVIGLAISLYQIAADLEKEKEKTDQTVTQVLSLLKASAAQAAFSLDNHLAKQVVEGLFEFAPIFQAEIRDDFGGMLAHSERDQSEGGMKLLANIVIGEFKSYEVPLIWEESNQAIGKMVVTVDTYLVAANFFERAKLILISGILRNLVLALLLVTLFYFTLTKPLMATVGSLSDIRADGSSEQTEISMPRGHEKDEIGLIVKTGNQVIEEYQQHLLQRELDAKEVHRLQNLLGSVVDSMPSALVGVDEYGLIMQWNKEAEKATGINAAQALAKHIADVYPMLEAEMERVHLAIRDNKPSRVKRIFMEREGATHSYEISVYPLSGDSISGAVIRVDDVTEKVQLEDVMIQAEKMLSVGGLAAGMAHEINNPLAGILQNVQVIQSRLTKDTPKNIEVAEACGGSMEQVAEFLSKRQIYSMLEMIMDSGRRAAKIVDNMLSFSRKGGSSREFCDVVKLLDNTVELAANDYDLKRSYDFKQVVIERDYAKDLPEVQCESSQIQQVILNLLKNGAEAMAEVHEIATDSKFTLRIRKEVTGVRIEVEDNGPGMPDEVTKRVFEPFFTTKPVGVGTGLGLSVSYFIIVENHGGEMSVESRVDNGTKFTIRLPYE